MFSVELYRTQFAYHWHTTRRLLECAAKVGEANYTARPKPEDVRASLHEVLFHLLGVDRAWRLGLESGDSLRSINGFSLTDPQKALEAYARLRTADHLSVAIERGGQLMTVDFIIR